MSITGPVDGPPYKAGVALTDVITGLYAAIGILACLHARSSSGHGYVLDLALLNCAWRRIQRRAGVPDQRAAAQAQGNAHMQIVPYQLFATADSWLALAVGNDGQWQRFCDAVDCRDWAVDPRFATNTARVRNRQILVPLVEALLKTRSTGAWRTLLEKDRCPMHRVVVSRFVCESSS